jgi:hypothetical protein
LVCGSIFVDGDVDVVVTQDSCGPEECGEEVWNNVEGVVEVDGEKILVVARD